MISLKLAAGNVLILLGMGHHRAGSDRLFGNRFVRRRLQRTTANRRKAFPAGAAVGIVAPPLGAIATLSVQRLRQSALFALCLGWSASALSQGLPDKSAPSERNTDLQFDYAVTNMGKRGNYRIVRSDTGQVLASGQVGTDVSPLTTLQNQFAVSGLLPGTPLAIQVQKADGTWWTVDNVKVHYPPEPGDSQRYFDDAGYRGDFTVPDLASPSPSPASHPSAGPAPSAAPTGGAAGASPSPSASPGGRMGR